MASDRQFTYAGLATRGTKVHFRASNRAGYGDILTDEGDTNVKIVKLPKPMSKDEAKAFLGSLKSFPEMKAFLKGSKTAEVPLVPIEVPKPKPVMKNTHKLFPGEVGKNVQRVLAAMA